VERQAARKPINQFVLMSMLGDSQQFDGINKYHDSATVTLDHHNLYS
jgi:hypothetical protein